MAQEYAYEPKDTAADQATGRLLSAEVLNNHLLTARQAAARFGRTCRTLRNWERRRWLIPIRIGRGVFYRQRDIEVL